MITVRMRSSLKNTMLSWFNNMAYTEINTSFKECNQLEKLICNVEKYYSKYKCLGVSQSDSKFLTNQLKKIQKEFEDYITIKGDDTIEYSPQLLSLLLLDYMLLEEKDLSLRVKFGHLHIGGLLTEIEDKNKTIAYSSYKIVNKMISIVNKL